MPHAIEVEGTVRDVVSHRFAIATRDGKGLADLGPDAVDRTGLEEGDAVRVAGGRRRPEIEAETRVAPDGTTHRKSAHWEIDARRDGRLHRLHVTLEGRIREAEPIVA